MCSSLAEEPLAQAVLSMLSLGESVGDSTCPRIGLNAAVTSHTDLYASKRPLFWRACTHGVCCTAEV